MNAISSCISCGCTDDAACIVQGVPCSWLRVDRPSGKGVCSACPKDVVRWDAGDRKAAKRTTKVGVVIDKWKLQIFRKHLTRAGYVFRLHPGVTQDTLTLRVDAENPIALQKVVTAANEECARARTD